MHYVKHNGWIEVICGSMFSGKSEELIRRLYRAELAKVSIAVFKPTIDDRYSRGAVVSHNGTSIEAHAIQHSTDIFRHIDAGVACIGIDEVQFFDDQLVDVVQALADQGIRVICAGLDQDFRGEPFGPIGQLMAVAEYVSKLHAICVKCGSLASRTQRLIDGEPAHYDDPVILVGAAESYEPRCRHCHEVKGKEKQLSQMKVRTSEV